MWDRMVPTLNMRWRRSMAPRGAKTPMEMSPLLTAVILRRRMQYLTPHGTSPSEDMLAAARTAMPSASTTAAGNGAAPALAATTAAPPVSSTATAGISL